MHGISLRILACFVTMMMMIVVILKVMILIAILFFVKTLAVILDQDVMHSYTVL